MALRPARASSIPMRSPGSMASSTSPTRHLARTRARKKSSRSDLPPGEVAETLRRAGMGWHFLCDAASVGADLKQRKADYKALGYRAMATEWVFFHDLRDIPVFECLPSVRHVQTAEEWGTIPQHSNQKRKWVEAFRQYLLWDDAASYGWADPGPRGSRRASRRAARAAAAASGSGTRARRTARAPRGRRRRTDTRNRGGSGGPGDAARRAPILRTAGRTAAREDRRSVPCRPLPSRHTAPMPPVIRASARRRRRAGGEDRGARRSTTTRCRCGRFPMTSTRLGVLERLFEMTIRVISLPLGESYTDDSPRSRRCGHRRGAGSSSPDEASELESMAASSATGCRGCGAAGRRCSRRTPRNRTSICRASEPTRPSRAGASARPRSARARALRRRGHPRVPREHEGTERRVLHAPGVRDHEGAHGAARRAEALDDVESAEPS